MKIKSLVFYLCFVISLLQKIQAADLVPIEVVEWHLKDYNKNEKALIEEDLSNIMALSLRGKVKTNQKVYLATAGAPGAIKSTILERKLRSSSAGHSFDFANFVYVDPDQRALKFMINTYLQEFSAFELATKPLALLQEQAYTKWRGGSNYIANSILNKSFSEGYSIAHGITSSAPQVKFLYEKLKSAGYLIKLILCGAPDQTRVEAVKHRETKQSFFQSTPEDFVEKGRLFVARFPDYFAFADQIDFYWTGSLLTGSVYVGHWDRVTKVLTVVDQRAFNAFKEKYENDRIGTSLPEFDSFFQVPATKIPAK